MPCIKMMIEGKPAILCVGGPVYEFEGYKFENDHYFGPTNLNKRTGEPLVHQSDEFFATALRWQTLPEAERETYRAERNK